MRQTSILPFCAYDCIKPHHFLFKFFILQGFDFDFDIDVADGGALSLDITFYVNLEVIFTCIFVRFSILLLLQVKSHKTTSLLFPSHSFVECESIGST